MNDSATRSVLVGKAVFDHLRRHQLHAAEPRMDMRYHLDGALRLLELERPLLRPWMHESRCCLATHLAQAEETATAPGATGEGAEPTARAHGAALPAVERRLDCRSLRLSEHGFDWLKGIQGTTRDPRLEMRWLIEGALTLLIASPHLHPQWVTCSRDALQAHLVELRTQGVGAPSTSGSLETPS
jgi:hypothetical protein